MSGSSRLVGMAGIAVALAGVMGVLTSRASDEAASLERGRYIAQIAGCNDCHTPGYAETGGDVAERDWLIGTTVGWKGAWGTTYPANLRLYMQRLTEDQWITVAKETQLRPPMPWFALRDMTD
jgi:mono/diheme cytochrome c family protein